MDDITTRLAGLEDRLIAIEVKQTLPWFRQPSLIVSILALILSLSAFIFGLIQESKSTQQQLILRLHEKFGEFGRIQGEAERKIMQTNDPNEIHSLNTQYSSQGRVIASELMAIAKKVGTDLSAVDSFNVGDVLYRVQQYNDAYQFFQIAFDNAQSEIDSATAIQAMALVHFMPGKLFDLQEGRRLFKLAIEKTALLKDPKSRFNEAIYTERWAELEKRSNNIEEAIRLYKDSLDLYEKQVGLNNMASVRADAVRNIIVELNKPLSNKE